MENITSINILDKAVNEIRFMVSKKTST